MKHLVKFQHTGSKNTYAGDALTLNAHDLEGMNANANCILPLNYFGAGPYNTDQLMDLELSDFTSGFELVLTDNPPGSRALGIVTELEVVPEPATMSLLAIGGLALLRRRKRVG